VTDVGRVGGEHVTVLFNHLYPYIHQQFLTNYRRVQ
jgi:hypothetical protein